MFRGINRSGSQSILLVIQLHKFLNQYYFINFIHKYLEYLDYLQNNFNFKKSTSAHTDKKFILIF